MSDSVTPWTAARQTSLSFSISRSLAKLISIELVMPFNHFILCHPLLLLPSIFPASGSFPMSHLFGHSVVASASATVLPMNMQGWFPLTLTVSFSVQSNGLSRVFSTPQFENINSLTLSLLYGPTNPNQKQEERRKGFCAMVESAREFAPVRGTYQAGCRHGSACATQHGVASFSAWRMLHVLNKNMNDVRTLKIIIHLKTLCTLGINRYTLLYIM